MATRVSFHRTPRQRDAVRDQQSCKPLKMVERVKGVEPSLSAWGTDNEARKLQIEEG